MLLLPFINVAYLMKICIIFLCNLINNLKLSPLLVVGRASLPDGVGMGWYQIGGQGWPPYLFSSKITGIEPPFKT